MHPRFLILLLTCVALQFPGTAEAGPLFDWLFQRNRSQSVNGYNGYGNSPYATTSNYRGPNQPACTSCLSNLFPRNRSNAFAGNYPNNANAGYPNAAGTAPNNAYAAAGQNPNGGVYPQTAGYAPQGGCAAGWCQQTVVRWVPQTAYRTDYQRVPVTTYKTSSSINPANGLPLTCTRPCTSYVMQPRRVPYTTYRPMYTTVPVSDPLAQSQPTPAPNYASYPPAPTSYSSQLPPTQNPGCVGCQSNTAAAYAGYGSWSNVPGYTPGDAANLAPALRASPWSSGSSAATQATPWPSQDGYASQRDASGATPWRSLAGGPSSTYGRVPSATGSYADSPGATEWRTLGPDGLSGPPSGGTGTGVPADVAPRLNRPNYEGYDEYNRARDAEMPDYLRRRISGSSPNQLVPRGSSSDDTSYRYDARRNYSYSSGPDSGSFSESGVDSKTRSQSGSPSSGAPDLQGPSNGATTQSQPILGIPDRRRSPTGNDANFDFDDRTAGRRPQGTRPVIEDTSHTRYAATPIPWERSAADSPRPRRFDWQKQASRTQRQPASAWTPVR